MTLTNRRAGLEDVETLIALMKEFYAESGFDFDAADARRAFASLLGDSRLGAAWLLAVDGDVAGYFVMSLVFSVGFGGMVATLDDLFVRPAFRRRGLGRAALGELRNAAKSLDLHALHLEVDPANDAAMTLYRSAGFRERTLRSMILPLVAPLHERAPGSP
jgi:ribosomal protein S18 acetylase RimI-like enzyme